MKKYIMLGWPEIQEYMNHPDYPKDCYFDPQKNVWFIPENWENTIKWFNSQSYV